MRRALVSATRVSGPVLAAVLACVSQPAGAQLQCRAGTLAFYPGGSLKSCEIDANHRFFTPQGDPIHCVSGGVVTQYPGGEIRSCTIDRPHTFAGARCEGPGQVELAPDGTLRRCAEGDAS